MRVYIPSDLPVPLSITFAFYKYAVMRIDNELQTAILDSVFCTCFLHFNQRDELNVAGCTGTNVNPAQVDATNACPHAAPKQGEDDKYHLAIL